MGTLSWKILLPNLFDVSTAKDPSLVSFAKLLRSDPTVINHPIILDQAKLYWSHWTITLSMAYFRRKPEPGLIHHSDRGSQYASYDYRNLLNKYHMIGSMSKKGDCWDNAVVESFFKSLKTERTSERSYQTKEELRVDVMDYIEMFYNSERLHSTIGYSSI